MTNPALNKPIPDPERPRADWRCSNCEAWGKSVRVIQQPNGQAARVSDLIAAGVKIDPATVLEVAQCTMAPIWNLTTHDHWCWQIKPRVHDVSQEGK